MHALSLRWITGRRVVIAVPFLWLTFAFLVPFLIVMRISFTESDGGNPFGTLMTMVDGVITLKVKISNYLFIAQDDLYVMTYLSSLKFAAITTVLCLIIGYPFAYFMARARSTLRPVLMMMVMLPFWTSFLLRIYAWKGILANNGILNHILMSMGVISEPLHLMNTQFSLIIGMVYAYLPFMILPLYA
ncbi:putrescine ABC transporter permease PotH, partial [Pseudoduganella sp. CY13W]|nr:putrescine ABC transporter permease PotH [Duganella qianjiadongensis]